MVVPHIELIYLKKEHFVGNNNRQCVIRFRHCNRNKETNLNLKVVLFNTNAR